MTEKLTRRAVVALSITAGSLFLLLCFAGYGAAEAESAHGRLGLSDRVAAWFVGPLGAGAHVIAALGVAWGVIVYFRERTPDLVLRLAGTATLAASTAMLWGLLSGGQRSVWAGTVGTAGARMLYDLGTGGVVLGWVVVLALVGWSFVFATDWVFHTLRRGERPAFDPSSLPVEPSRGDLLEDPAETEPREFVRSESRAAAAARTIESSEPRPLEVQPESLPAGFSAVQAGSRAIVRGPQGYAGVEFLSTADELAPPAVDVAPHATEVRSYAGVLEDSWEVQDLVMSMGPEIEIPAEPETVRETAHDTVALTPSSAAPESHDVETTADVASPVEETPQAPVADTVQAPATGIGLADPSLFEDDWFVVDVPEFGAESAAPHDGGSMASEIASAWTEPTPVETAAPAAEAIAAVAPEAAEAIAAVAPEAAKAIAPEAVVVDDVQDEEPAFLDDDFVVGGASVLLDDELFVEESSPAAEPVVAVATAVEVRPTVETAAALEPVVAEQESAVAPIEPAVADEPIADVVPEAVAVAEPDVAVVSPVVAPSIEQEPVLEPIAEEAPAPVADAAPVAPAAPEPVAPVAAQLALFPAPSCDLSRLRTMELDPLFIDAAQAILDRGRASAVVLQRALGIGYARGLRILDQMTEAGMLGPDSPGGSREVCFTREAWTGFLGGV